MNNSLPHPGRIINYCQPSAADVPAYRPGPSTLLYRFNTSITIRIS